MTAKWLGVAPWDLADQPSDWFDAASTVMEAEHGAQAEIQKRKERAARMKRRGA